MKFFKLLTLVFIIEGVYSSVCAGNVVSSDSIVAVINGRPVHYSELLREMYNLRWSVVEPIDTHETAKDYWLRKQGDSTRIQRLYERALQVLIAQKVQEQLLAAFGLWSYNDDEAMRQHLIRVNDERARQKKRHLIYGPDQYDLQTFYEYQTNTALIRIKELLVANETLPITEKALHTQYAEMKKGPYADEKFTFDTYKRQIQAAYIEQAYHRWIERRIGDASVIRQQTPSQEELDSLIHEAGPFDKKDLHANASHGNTYYVDSFSGNDRNDGRCPDQAWKTLNKINVTTFGPGDRILFRRGGIWFGKLKPGGNGLIGASIVINAYGKGPRPLFHGDGLQGHGVVNLYNQSHWQISGLEIVNPALYEGDRRGVEIKGENAGVIRSIHLHDLHIHHIKGIRGHDYASKRTGGIYFAVVDDRQRPTRFDDISVSNCLLHHLSNQGIVTNNERNHKDYPGTERWQQQKFTDVRIHQNVLHHISKNAIIIRLTENGLIERNLCYETALGMSGNTMFTISSLGTTFQFNEGFLNRSTDADGSLYDPDLGSPRTTWQYSYSHNNAHGLVWFCTRKVDSGIVVRHNISSNDYGYLVYVNYAFSGAKIYDNTFYIGEQRSPIVIRENPGNTHVYQFSDNQVYNYSSGTDFGFADSKNEKQHRILRNNYYQGIIPPSTEQSPKGAGTEQQPKPIPPYGYYDVASWFGSAGGKADVYKVNVYRNLRYGEKPEDVYAKDMSSDRLLDLYLPMDEAGTKKPVILFVHGGGFGGGDKSAHEQFFRSLASHGFAVISANYRLYLKHHKIPGASASLNMAKGLRVDGKFHPELQKAVVIASDDASKVLRWIKSNADTYDIDARRVAVSGGSAGAMTVLHLAYASGQQVLPVQAVVNMWGGLQDAAVIHAEAPPMLTFHGDKDALIHVNYAYALDSQMKKRGCLSELYVLKGKGHAIYDVISKDHIATIVSFLRKVLK